MTSKTNGTQTVTIRHPIFNDRFCYVHLKKYRYLCPVCNRTFMAKTHLAPENKTYSYALIQFILEETKHSTITFSYLSEKTGFSITKIIDIFMEYCPNDTIQLPRVLCIDEVYLGRSSVKKYGTFCMDFETRLGYSFTYGRSTEDLTRFFSTIPREQRLQVEYVSSDMYPGFIRLVHTYFPKAKLCIDSFHVIKNINDQLKNTIQSTLRNLDRDSQEYNLLKKNQNLQLSYQLKERYLSFNRKESFNEGLFDELVSDYKKSSLQTLRIISHLLIRNKEYIRNSFTRIHGKRISNGPIESRNKAIKNILSNANGYRNFELLVKRVLHVLNHISLNKNRRIQ